MLINYIQVLINAQMCWGLDIYIVMVLIADLSFSIRSYSGIGWKSSFKVRYSALRNRDLECMYGSIC